MFGNKNQARNPHRYIKYYISDFFEGPDKYRRRENEDMITGQMRLSCDRYTGSSIFIPITVGWQHSEPWVRVPQPSCIGSVLEGGVATPVRTLVLIQSFCRPSAASP